VATDSASSEGLPESGKISLDPAESGPQHSFFRKDLAVILYISFF
jgi:hypothetical protein